MSDSYNPDVLSCLANLSSDEVFTPPEIVNQMLDLLPQELFTNPETKFLDPFTKSGVFLREIAKRLIIGLEGKIPCLEDRIEHIFKNQLYGIAITELTSLLSRRSLYCSKYPNSKYSVAKFDNIEGNIRFKRIEHTWKNKKSIWCGASKDNLGDRENLETHAYEFIHTSNPERIFNMKFDVIIGNPPYQLDDGGAFASASPIYHLFILNAIKLNPKYVSMIVPSRWFTGGKGLDEFREFMLRNKNLKEIHDFPDASDCFNGVEIKGGVNYFIWQNDYNGDCLICTHQGDKIVSKAKRSLLEPGCDVFIRNNELVSIYKKIWVNGGETFAKNVSPLKPYGLRGDFFKDPHKYGLPPISVNPIEDGLAIYGLDDKFKRSIRYVPGNYPLPRKDFVKGYKMFMARNQGSGFFGETFSVPVFGKPNECCTETFVAIGPFKTEKEMMNCYSYIKTKFFRAMVGVKKNDQGASQGIYQYVPNQDFSKPWSDKELYEKYNLSEEEIKFIEDNVKIME